jgi:hypothetical protein
MNGWHVHHLVAELAMSLGWLGSKDPSVSHRGEITRRDAIRATTGRRGEVRAILSAYRQGDDNTTYRGNQITCVADQVLNQGGIADDATDYLNTLAPEGYAFGWHEGSLYLQSEEWWRDEAA